MKRKLKQQNLLYSVREAGKHARKAECKTGLEEKVRFKLPPQGFLTMALSQSNLAFK
jgi:hypothetical protein